MTTSEINHTENKAKEQSEHSCSVKREIELFRKCRGYEITNTEMTNPAFMDLIFE